MKHSDHNTEKKSGIYTCPMPEHHHVLQYGEGKCSECGMNLVPVEDTKIDSIFVCPMEEDKVVSDKQGRCPKCNMKLKKIEFKKEEPQESKKHKQTDMDHSNLDFHPDERVATGGHDIYTCPMESHYNVMQYGEGKCSECNMNLVKLEKTANKKVYVCPMTECKTVQDHKGECPVCGMDLVGYKTENQNDR